MDIETPRNGSFTDPELQLDAGDQFLQDSAVLKEHRNVQEAKMAATGDARGLGRGRKAADAVEDAK